MKNYYGEELKTGSYYDFMIFLNSPYKWGSGWEGVSNITITENYDWLNQCMKAIGFTMFKDKEGWSCATFYNDKNMFEETYLHPMEISGTMTLENILKLEEYIKNNGLSHTNFCETRIFKEVFNYHESDMVQMFELIKENVPNIIKKNKCGVALDYNFRDIEGISFKEYSFVKLKNFIEYETRKEILIEYLNNEIRKVREMV